MNFGELDQLQYLHNGAFHQGKDDCLQISPDDFDKICRTCLSNQQIQPIFDLRYNEMTLLDLLFNCLSVQVRKQPNKIIKMTVQVLAKISDISDSKNVWFYVCFTDRQRRHITPKHLLFLLKRNHSDTFIQRKMQTK